MNGFGFAGRHRAEATVLMKCQKLICAPDCEPATFHLPFLRDHQKLLRVNDGLVEQQRHLLRNAQTGDAEALAGLRNELQSPLLNILLARGASATEAEEILADLWSDCVPGALKGASLLTKFTGNHPPLGWFARVAVNRWIDTKRRRAKLGAETQVDFDDLPGCVDNLEDNQLQSLLRASLKAAFASCPDESLLMLRLVYLHGLTQREVGRMLGWTESKTSRNLSEAMKRIERRTLWQLKQKHPSLEWTWDDLVALCASPDIDFL